MKLGNGEIGIDLGIKDLLIISNGEYYSNEKITYKYEERLAKLQRQLSKKKKGSMNFNKFRIRIARIHEKIRNKRMENLHKISTKIISKNQEIKPRDYK